jgi:hypothetical protein
MKKNTFLLLFAFLTTSLLFAQSMELTKTTDLQAPQVNKSAELLEIKDREMNTVKSVQTRSQDSEMSMIEVSQASKANNELAMKNRLQENEAKSKLARKKREELAELVLLRLKKVNYPVLNSTISN